MDTGSLIWTYFFLISVCACAVSGSPIGTSVINCDGGGNEEFGPVDEGFSGDVELATGITAGSNVELVPHIFPAHLEFLELIFTAGEASATLRTKKPLDADVLIDSNSTLYYSIMCDGEIKYNNTRRLKITDLNDNGPVFPIGFYSPIVPESKPVNTEVLQVKAEDADITPANNMITYSIEPPSEDFMMNSSGALILKRPLNYNVVQSYRFTVTAQDSGGLSDSATVEIHVVDFDNLNPYFLHNLYQAFIPEEQVGFFSTIQPEAIKALDGDTGINMTLIYSISSVTPEKYHANFDIHSISGVVSVVTAIDREEMDSSTISINIKAAQADDPLKTADAVVSVTVEDINDNAPQFEKSEYSETVLENCPVGTVVLNVTVIDLDQGGFVGTLQIVPQSAPFSISSDGTVTVKNSSVLDRETIESFTFQEPTSEDFEMTSSGAFILKRRLNYTLVQSYSFTVKAQDNWGWSDTTTVQINVQDVDNLNPYFLRNLYQAFIPEEQVGVFRTIQPEAIKALDGDTGINMTLIYSISSVTPEKYRADFDIDSISGVVSVVTAIDREEMNSSTISVNIKAAQSDDTLKTADAVVSVTVEDINDNAPMFEKSEYSETVLENSPVGTVVFKATVIDLDQGGFVGTLRIVPQSAPFSISSDGTVTVKNSSVLDRETTESFTFQVLAVDQMTNGLTATVQVRVQVEDVNEAPQFPPEVHKASVFSTDPYKTPVILVKASDPDVGDEGQLEYSLVSGSPYFDVDASSGLVFVVSVVDLSGQAAAVEVEVTDPKGLHATAKVEVVVLGSTSRNDVVTISLNRPANVVEGNIPEMEKSLGKALSWTVDIIEVSNSTRGSPKSRTLREAVNSLVNFIAVDKAEVVSYEEVVKKLQSESAAVTAELTKVFGEGVRFAVKERPTDPDSDNPALTICLSVIVPCVLVAGFIGFGFFRVWFKRKAKKGSDMERVNMDESNEGYRNPALNISETSVDFDRRSLNHETTFQDPDRRSLNHETTFQDPDRRSLNHETTFQDSDRRSLNHETTFQDPDRRSLNHETTFQDPDRRSLNHETTFQDSDRRSLNHETTFQGPDRQSADHDTTFQEFDGRSLDHETTS